LKATVEKPIPDLKASTIQNSRTIKEAANDLIERGEVGEFWEQGCVLQL
jgi:hypothetical protein